MKDLSVLIPARNEMFLKNTVEDILRNSEADTEVLVGLDGKWADPPIKDDDNVKILYYPESIGQRAMTNRLAKLSRAKYVMKCDAHCAFDKGFDRKMIEDMQDDWTMVPIMKNLHVFDWVCEKCGERWYMGPVPEKCKNEECDSAEFRREIVWKPKPSPNSTSYRFNTDLRFKYFGEYKSEQEGHLAETMSLQGSCFLATREKYWELKLCDEDWGSWGQQGTEVALKTWLSGGRVVCNKRTWYAHMFRTREGFTWPYPAPGKSQQKAIKICKNMFLNNKWDKQVRPLSWLIEKFKPVPVWHFDRGDEKQDKETLDRVMKEGEKFGNFPEIKKPVKKGIIFYTDNELKLKIAHKVQDNLERVAKDKGLPIVCSSIKPMDHFGDKNVRVEEPRGYLTMFRQQLAALEASEAEIVFFCEHDIMYHPSHFDFTPPEKDKFYYNTNVWRVRSSDGLAVRTDDCRQVSGLCGYRELLLEHYRKRVEMVEEKLKELGEGGEFNRFVRRMGFEPGTHGRKERVDDYKSDTWESAFPNVDIRHGKNVTRSKWRPEDYRNKRFAEGWQETREIPFWGDTGQFTF